MSRRKEAIHRLQFDRVQSISSWLSELGQMVPLLQRQMIRNPLLVFAPLEQFPPAP